jgi:hypothetical protein
MAGRILSPAAFKLYFYTTIPLRISFRFPCQLGYCPLSFSGNKYAPKNSIKIGMASERAIKQIAELAKKDEFPSDSG